MCLSRVETFYFKIQVKNIYGIKDGWSHAACEASNWEFLPPWPDKRLWLTSHYPVNTWWLILLFGSSNDHNKAGWFAPYSNRPPLDDSITSSKQRCYPPSIIHNMCSKQKHTKKTILTSTMKKCLHSWHTILIDLAICNLLLDFSWIQWHFLQVYLLQLQITTRVTSR